MVEFFIHQMDYLNFVCGIGFFLLSALCFTIPSKNQGQFSWQWFAVFSLLYGLFSWFKIINVFLNQNVFILEVSKLLVILALLSLVEFARQLSNSLQKTAVQWWIYGVLWVGIYILTTLGVPNYYSAARIVMGVIGGMLVFIQFLSFAKVQKESTYLYYALALMFGFLFVLIQFDIPRAEYFPAVFFNQDTFLNVLHIPVSFFLALLGITISLVIWYLWEGSLLLNQVSYEEKNSQRFVGLILGILAVLIWLGFFIANRLGDEEASFRRDTILSMAQQNALKIDSSRIRALTGTLKDLQSVNYLQLKHQLQSLKDVLKNVRFLYLMRKVNDHVVFLVDSEPQGSKDESPPGQIYGEATEDMVELFSSHSSLVKGPFYDRWGRWVSGFTPIYEPGGTEILAVLGIDQNAAEFEHAVFSLRMGTIGFLSIPILFVLTLLMFRRKLLEAVNTSSEFDPAGQLLRWSTLIGLSLTGFVLTSFLFFLNQHASVNSYQKIFHQRAVARSVGVEQVLSLQIQKLAGIQSLFRSNHERLAKDEFQSYVDAMQTKGLPQWFAWMPVEEGETAEKFASHNISWLPLNDAEHLKSVDLLSEDYLRAAFKKAARENRIVISQPFFLKTITKKMLTMLVAPIYHTSFEPNSSDNFSALRGFVVNIFESEVLLRSAYSRFPAEGLACLIEDPQAPIDTRILYRHKVRIGLVDWDNPHEEYLTTLDIADRQWRMTVVPGSAFRKNNLNDKDFWMIPFGFVLTALVCFFINLLMMRRHEAELLIQSLRTAKDRGEEASRLKNEFIFNISHEMRTPLNGIIGFAELVESSKELTHAQGMARMIISESEVLLALVNEVLDQAKLEAKKITLEPSPTELMEVINYVRRKADLQAAKKGLKVEVQVAFDVPQFVFVDRMRLCQILINLLNNSVKFTFKGGVTLIVRNKGSAGGITQLYFAVRDTGIGIPQDKQHLIFQHFTQIDGTLTRHFGGAGLGLSIVKGIVDLMGGKIGFESLSGQGTTFWFTIPVHLSTGQSGEMSVVDKTLYHNVAGTEATILVVEDYPPNLDIVRFHLEEAGYKVKVAGNGAVALEICSHEVVHLILMDIQMPVLDGYKATQQLRAMDGWRKKVPILGFTANADNKTLHECLTIGMNGIIVKPVRKAMLLTEVAQWLKPPDSQEQVAEDGLSVVSDENLKLVIFDHPTAIEEFGGNSSLLDIMVRSFLLQVHQQVSIIDEAIQKKDSATIGREAHKIRGAAANLTATLLAQKAKELELKGKANDLISIQQTFQSFRQELEKFENFIKNGYKEIH